MGATPRTTLALVCVVPGRATVAVVFAFAACGWSCSSDCGRRGQGCCLSSPACTEPDTACAYVNLPMFGHCDHCGNAGEPCCDIGNPCSPGMACASQGISSDSSPSCAACGGFEQICCDGRHCSSSLACEGQASVNGVCLCGNLNGTLNEPCCNGTDCVSPFVCVGAQCRESSDAGTADAPVDVSTD